MVRTNQVLRKPVDHRKSQNRLVIVFILVSPVCIAQGFRFTIDLLVTVKQATPDQCVLELGRVDTVPINGRVRSSEAAAPPAPLPRATD